MRFSDNLRNLRLTRRMTQMKLAEGLGTSQSAVAAWENGTREPDFRTIKKISDYFNVSMSTLLPSNDALDESYVNSIAESLQQNPKLNLLFEKARTMPESDLDVILSVVNAILRERVD